uniref:Uncharacterized protein n=1 Tax=Tanacetum cinerariifolium TaxID=118510 RepID=A0A6L2MRS1_TANCI|nr:hypothetical protein [Tanacetum cinerariifolium]
MEYKFQDQKNSEDNFSFGRLYLIVFLLVRNIKILPKKSRGKGSQGKKTVDTSEFDVDVSKESDSEPARKRTGSRRVIKKKVTISTDDNIIPEPNIALEPLGIAFRDTSSVSKKKSPDPSQKLKGVQTLTPEEQLDADTMKALKECKKTSKRQSGTGGSSEETGVTPRVPDESTFVYATSSEGTGTKPRVLDKEKVTSEANVILDWGSEQKREYSKKDDDNDDDDDHDDDDDKSINLEKTDDEETVDEFVHNEENVQDDDEEKDDELILADEQVNDYKDEELTNAKDADTRNDDEEITDAAKADVEKIEKAKDDNKKAKLPPISSSLSVSSGPLARPNQGKKTKRSRTKESKPSKKSFTSKETSKGKSSAKTSKSDKSVAAEEPVEEPIFEMASDDIEQIVDEVANDVDQPPDDSTQNKDKAPKQDWFKQPARPPTPNLKWNKRQVVVDQPEQPWSNQMVYVAKDLLTFDELMATSIDFSNYAMNRLKIDNLTQAHLVGTVYEVLKGTCTSSIELEYNMEERFKALTDILNWNNPEGDCYPP